MHQRVRIILDFWAFSSVRKCLGTLEQAAESFSFVLQLVVFFFLFSSFRLSSTIESACFIIVYPPFVASTGPSREWRVDQAHKLPSPRLLPSTVCTDHQPIKKSAVQPRRTQQNDRLAREATWKFSNIISKTIHFTICFLFGYLGRARGQHLLFICAERLLIPCVCLQSDSRSSASQISASFLRKVSFRLNDHGSSSRQESIEEGQSMSDRFCCLPNCAN